MHELPGQLNLFEHAGPLRERLRAEEPFANGPALLQRAGEILDELSEAQQIAVINAHPRIGERPDKISAASFKEQVSAVERKPKALIIRLLRARNPA